MTMRAYCLSLLLMFAGAVCAQRAEYGIVPLPKSMELPYVVIQPADYTGIENREQRTENKSQISNLKVITTFTVARSMVSPTEGGRKGGLASTSSTARRY